MALKSQFDNFEHKLDSFTAKSTSPSTDTAPMEDESARSTNIVMFGVAENKDMTIWRHDVDDALKFIVDKEVDIVDVFRLGRFDASKVRPILIKLRTVWDRRLVLNNSRRLKSYHQRIFVSPDEPLNTRRKRIFDRLKYKAVKDGKSVITANDILVVDGIQVFSLSAGHLNVSFSDRV